MTTRSGSVQRIAILSALPQEVHEIQDALTERQEVKWAGGSMWEGILDGTPVVLGVCGVGKTLAAMSTQYLLERYAPRALLFVGLAGALSARCSQGDVILGAELLQHDIDARAAGFKRAEIPYTGIRELRGDPNLLAIAAGASGAGLRVIEGRILTGDQFISRRVSARKEAESELDWDYLASELAGDAVEMEGASVALVAHLHQVPCLITRTISDGGDSEAFKDFSGFLEEASHRSLRLLRHILSNY